eukprot:GILI01022111.1.p1 GENE.GILI01022111.1~~GILI01022111.1.p1  ORF type:complete len:503 (+),score=31.40 GILI01022111.1:115-1623(+)
MTSPSICGQLEKRNAFGIWTSKYIEVDSSGQRVTVSDKEGVTPSQVLDIRDIGRADPVTLVFYCKTDELTLRAPNPETSDDWFETVRDLLVDLKLIPHPNYGLPDDDPRNGLPFCEIPPEYNSKFKDLRKSILYWFAPVTKYGNINSLTGHRKIEDRVGFLGDKAFYVTRQNSEITRCIKIERLVCLYTNLGSKDLQDKTPFLVLKLDNNGEYDLCFEAKNMLPLIRALKVLYRYNSNNKARQLKVVTVPTYDDPVIDIKLHRPAEFETVTVIPSSKLELKKRLTTYYREKGMPFPSIERKPKKMRRATERHPSVLFESKEALISATKDKDSNLNKDSNAASLDSSSAPDGKSSDVSATEPLAVYLQMLGLSRYCEKLNNQQVEFDMLDCMDETDFKNFGVRDSSHIRLIISSLGDSKLIAEVHKVVEANRLASNWSFSTAAPKVVNGMIELSDDDELPVRPSAPIQQPSQRPAISLDSDDDLVVAPKPQPKMVINLSEDDL